MRLEFHPHTVSDLDSATMYYDRQRTGLGDALRAEVYLAIEQVRANPLQFAVVKKGIRRCLVHRFPYAVLFRIVNDDLIRILVIRHHRRHQSVGTARR
jgi:toxin ParE1/3/4